MSNTQAKVLPQTILGQTDINNPFLKEAIGAFVAKQYAALELINELKQKGFNLAQNLKLADLIKELESRIEQTINPSANTANNSKNPATAKKIAELKQLKQQLNDLRIVLDSAVAFQTNNLQQLNQATQNMQQFIQQVFPDNNNKDDAIQKLTQETLALAQKNGLDIFQEIQKITNAQIPDAPEFKLRPISAVKKFDNEKIQAIMQDDQLTPSEKVEAFLKNDDINAMNALKNYAENDPQFTRLNNHISSQLKSTLESTVDAELTPTLRTIKSQGHVESFCQQTTQYISARVVVIIVGNGMSRISDVANSLIEFAHQKAHADAQLLNYLIQGNSFRPTPSFGASRYADDQEQAASSSFAPKGFGFSSN